MSARLISSSSSPTRLRIWSFGRFRTRSPKPMLSATDMFGNSAYDWNTIPTLRRFAGLFVMSFPAIVIVPAVGRSKPAIIRSVVVLPQPDGPRNDTNSPFSAARLKSSTAACGAPGNCFWTPSSTRKDISALLRPSTVRLRPRAERPIRAMTPMAAHVRPKLIRATAAGS